MNTGIFGSLAPHPQQQARLHHWQGASGMWWVTTVYPLLAEHLNIPSVYVIVRRDSTGKVYPLYIGQTSDTGRRMNEHLKDKLPRAIAFGGNELHLHFLARTEADRFTVETDLRGGHATPLNEQPSASYGGLFGLGALYRANEQKSLLGQVGMLR